MRVEQETLLHCFRHLNKAAIRYGETQFILADPRTYRRVKQTDKAPVTFLFILYYSHRDDRATSRTKLRYHSIRSVVAEECPAAQTGKHIWSGIEQHT